MTTFSNILGRTCVACGQERKKKDMIAYHPATFEPYCSSEYYCNEEHPNSPKNVAQHIAEQKYLPYGRVELMGFEEAKAKYANWLEANHQNPDKVKKIRKMVENPMTLRIGSPELAEFILDLQEDMQFSSVSDTIRFCIQSMIEKRGSFKKEFKEQTNLHQATKIIETPKQEIKPEPAPVSVSFNF